MKTKKQAKLNNICTVTQMHHHLAYYDNVKDNGRFGKVYEQAVREYSSGRRSSITFVKGQGKADLNLSAYGKRFTCEIKTACGEVEMAEKSQLIIYCPDVDINYPAEKQGFVFTREEWKNFLAGYTGRGKFLRQDSNRNHLHIQSFYTESRPKASKPIAEYIWDTCTGQPTIEEFLMEGRKEA